MERTLAPIGAASTRTTLFTSASSSSAGAGRGLPAILASRAGTRVSRTRVVFPAPETPVTAVMRFSGMSSSSGLTEWMAPDLRCIRPPANMAAAEARSRASTFSVPFRKPAIREFPFFSTSSTVPAARTFPPRSPAPGPISMSQSASLSTRTSWSTTTTVLPISTRSRMIPTSPSTLEGCRPMEGSSRT